MKIEISNSVLKTFLISLLLSVSCYSQGFEIIFDNVTIGSWFGGDNRPYRHINVGVAQSVTIDYPITLSSFSFYFTEPFDSALNGTGSGHEVSLKLHVRDSLGVVLTSKIVDVPETFNGGWISWDDIDYDIVHTGKYIFSSYLIGGFDSVKLNSYQGCDYFARYSLGERYINNVIVNDSDAVMWDGWLPNSYDAAFILRGSIITTEADYNENIVDEFSLAQNYPNPFNPTTKIKFRIPNVASDFSLSKAILKVYDVLGNEIATLINKELPAGEYEVEFDGSNLPGGVYFYQLRTGSFIQSKKMVLLK